MGLKRKEDNKDNKEEGKGDRKERGEKDKKRKVDDEVHSTSEIIRVSEPQRRAMILS